MLGEVDAAVSSPVRTAQARVIRVEFDHLGCAVSANVTSTASGLYRAHQLAEEDNAGEMELPVSRAKNCSSVSMPFHPMAVTVPSSYQESYSQKHGMDK